MAENESQKSECGSMDIDIEYLDDEMDDAGDAASVAESYAASTATTTTTVAPDVADGKRWVRRLNQAGTCCDDQTKQMSQLSLDGKGSGKDGKGSGKGSGKDGKGSGTKQAAGAKRKGAPADHQLRACTCCNKEYHWRRMKATYVDQTPEDMKKVQDTFQEVAAIKEGKVYGSYTYTCVDCTAKKDGITVQEASRAIKQPRTAKGLARCVAFEKAVMEVQSEWKFVFQGLGGELDDVEKIVDGEMETEGKKGEIFFKSMRQRKKETRRLAIIKANGMAAMFAPIAHLLALKYNDMKEAVLAAKNLQNWLEKETKGDEAESDLQEGDAVEEEFEIKLYKERAFEGHEDAARMRMAADYSDQWFTNKGMEFNVYYVCKGGSPQCMTAIEAKAWDRLREDLAATKQRWYCAYCGTKYKTRYGVLVEIVIKNKGSMYCSAEVPPFDIQDVKGMAIQEQYKKCETPEELLAALPRIVPRQGLVIERPGYFGHHAINVSKMEGVPTLDWSQLYNFRKK